MSDFAYMQKTLQLAAEGRGLVSPNPLVGSLVVKDGVIIGRGVHRYDEVKHAEVWALEEAGAEAAGATLYVNLEPCSHQGGGKRTTPCVQAILAAGIKRVVAAMVDPNPLVNGRGFDELRAAGVEVLAGVAEFEARRLNEKFIKYVTTSRPFVHLKTACSLDGRIATWTGESRWITGEAARIQAHQLRHEHDAIIVGIGTVLADDPLLTDRSGATRHRPLTRVVLDSRLRTPLDSQLVKTANEFPLIIFASAEGEIEKQDALEEQGAIVLNIEGTAGKLNLLPVLYELGRRQLTSLLVEGGAETAGSFLDARLVDKVTFFIAPKLIGGRAALSAIGGNGFGLLSEAMNLQDMQLSQLGDDFEITGYPQMG